MSQQNRGTDRAIRNAKSLKKHLQAQGVSVTLSQVQKALAETGNFKDFNTLIGAVRKAKNTPPGTPTSIICKELGPYNKDLERWPEQAQWPVHFVDPGLANPANTLSASLFDKSQDYDFNAGKDAPYSLLIRFTLHLADHVLTATQERTLFQDYDQDRFGELFSGSVEDGYSFYASVDKYDDAALNTPMPKPFPHYSIAIDLDHKPTKADINWLIEQASRWHQRECQRIIAENREIFADMIIGSEVAVKTLTFPVNTTNCGNHVGWITLPDALSDRGIYRPNPKITLPPRSDMDEEDYASRSTIKRSTHEEREKRRLRQEKLKHEKMEVPEFMPGDLGYPVKLKRHQHFWEVITEDSGSKNCPRDKEKFYDWHVVEAPGIEPGPNPIKTAKAINPFEAIEKGLVPPVDKTKPKKLDDLESYFGEEECPYCGEHQYSSRTGFCSHCD